MPDSRGLEASLRFCMSSALTPPICTCLHLLGRDSGGVACLADARQSSATLSHVVALQDSSSTLATPSICAL
eukprot:9309288-Alexandrium_andersonii.AAC.1